MVGIIIGAILVLGGVGMYFGSQSQKKKLDIIKGTETSTAAALKDIASSVAKDIGAGSFNQIVEVKGKIECDQPLASELSQTPCVHYSMKIDREWEETYWDTDSEGHRTQKTRRGSDNVSSNTRSIPFLVRDATGTIKVDPTGASIDSEKVFSRFDPGEISGGSIRIGRFALNLASNLMGGGRRTLGYRYEESAVPLGRDIYVLGEAVDSSGELRIQNPSQKGGKFIVSLKSEEQLVKSAGSATRGLMIGGCVAAALGVVLVILGALGVF